MKTLITLLLLGLVLSIKLAPAHLSNSPEISREEKEQWKIFKEECDLECLDHANEERDKNICEGLSEEACRHAKDFAESQIFLHCSRFCHELAHTGKEAFTKCSNEKCDGRRTKECAEDACEGEIKSAIEARVAQLEDQLPKKLDVLDSVELTPMDAAEKAFWDEKEKNCTERLPPEFEKAAGENWCEENTPGCAFKRAIIASFVDSTSDGICKKTTEEAVNIYETCVRINCEAKRSQQCLEETCRHSIDFFYRMSEIAMTEAAREGFQMETDRNGHHMKPLQLTGNAKADAMSQIPNPLDELVDPSDITVPEAPEAVSAEGDHTDAIDAALGLD